MCVLYGAFGMGSVSVLVAQYSSYIAVFPEFGNTQSFDLEVPKIASKQALMGVVHCPMC